MMLLFHAFIVFVVHVRWKCRVIRSIGRIEIKKVEKSISLVFIIIGKNCNKEIYTKKKIDIFFNNIQTILLLLFTYIIHLAVYTIK